MNTEVKAMEIKKNISSKNSQGLIWQTVKSFVKENEAEFKKITWTSKEELIIYTQIVVVATFVMGMSIYGLDVLIHAILSGLDSIMRLFI